MGKVCASQVEEAIKELGLFDYPFKQESKEVVEK